MIYNTGDSLVLTGLTWILGTVWEVVALCLAVRIAVKHFCELQQHSTRGIMVLMQTHVSYFAIFLVISCLHISLFSPTLSAVCRSVTDLYMRPWFIISMFVLGPRLILGIREYHAELVANFGTATAMASIAFQEHILVSTSSSVRLAVVRRGKENRTRVR
ncbi:hypothetical protein BDR07DRAFT_1015016 [Suillus spraguei]|nr:hypothetical protein BDR07DRAFT_1015016 [Suillus spraguei]